MPCRYSALGAGEVGAVWLVRVVWNDGAEAGEASDKQAVENGCATDGNCRGGGGRGSMAQNVMRFRVSDRGNGGVMTDAIPPPLQKNGRDVVQ